MEQLLKDWWIAAPALVIAGACAVAFVFAKLVGLIVPSKAELGETDSGLETIPKEGWRSIERIAAVLGILSFLIQTGQWIWPVVEPAAIAGWNQVVLIWGQAF